MVKLNNSYDGINSCEMDSYLRNLNDFRINSEVALLSVIDYFILRTEEGKEEINIPAKILESERLYLEQLGKKYYLRAFDFKVDKADSLETYDNITKLIRQTRKASDYSLLDSLDFIKAYLQLFDKVEIPNNLAMSMKSIAEEYNHKIPDRLEEILPEEKKESYVDKNNKYKKSIELKPFNKFISPFQLYTFVLSHVKQVMDFEILKLYDFLLESNTKEIRSNKLLEIEKELRATGEVEYFKKSFDIEILPLKKDTYIDVFNIVIDEWASNLRRIFELKHFLADDFVDFIENNDEIKVYKSGSFPELISLVNYKFRGIVPENLQIK